MKTRTYEQPYGAIYRKYSFLNMLSRKQIENIAKDSEKVGDKEFADACKIVLNTDNTRFRR